MEFIDVKADELLCGMRASDNSPWIKFHLGEYQKDVAGELFKIQGKDVIYKVRIEMEDGK